MMSFKYVKVAIVSLLIATSSFSFGGMAIVSASSSQIDACAGLSQLDNAPSCGAAGTSIVQRIANNLVVLISIVAGIIAVVTIIIAGFQYITSGGDATGVGKAKTALSYSVIGLAVAALAQFLVHFVIRNI